MKSPIALRVSSLGFLCFIMASLFINHAEAAIPHSRTILSRLARNNGRGVYVVEQELRFSGADGIVLKEKWLVQNAESMRLVVTSTSPGEYRFDALYRDKHRSSSSPLALIPNQPTGEPSKKIRVQALPHDFFEPYLYFRTTAKYLEYFVRAKILPPSALRDRPQIGNINTYKPIEERGVRLGKTAGTVAWVFGEPTPVDASIDYPGAWVEQDTFLLRKVRLPSQAEMVLSEHTTGKGGIHLPHEQSISWTSSELTPSTNSVSTQQPKADGAMAVTIKVLSVKQYPDRSLAPQFLASSITPQELQAAKLPDVNIVREFYTRFR